MDSLGFTSVGWGFEPQPQGAQTNAQISNAQTGTNTLRQHIIGILSDLRFGLAALGALVLGFVPPLAFDVIAFRFGRFVGRDALYLQDEEIRFLFGNLEL